MPRQETKSGIAYTTISNYLRKKIYSQEWEPGHRIPSENELRMKFSVSRGTVRRAIADLVDEGLLEQVRGSGTFVTDTHLTHPGGNRPLSFAESLHLQNKDFVTKVLVCERKPATLAVAAHLGIEEGDPALHLVRLRTVDDVPVMLIASWVPLDVCPDIDKLPLDTMSLFDAVEFTSGRKIWRSEMTYSARTAGKELGDNLRINEKMPVLCLEQLISLEDGACIEWNNTTLSVGQTIVGVGYETKADRAIRKAVMDERESSSASTEKGA